MSTLERQEMPKGRYNNKGQAWSITQRCQAKVNEDGKASY